MGLFGRSTPENPREKVREWTRKIRHEMRSVDREIHGIERKEAEVKRTLKDAAKRGDKDVARILAKELVQSHKAIAKMHTSKAQMNSVVMQMNHQAATVRMAGSLQKSTEVMKSMQQLVKIPQISETMRNLSREMMRAGILEEMIEDTMESLEPEGLEEEADAEVDKVLWEITDGVLGKMPEAVSGSLAPSEVKAGPSKARASPAQAEALADENLTDMQDRLEQLRS